MHRLSGDVNHVEDLLRDTVEEQTTLPTVNVETQADDKPQPGPSSDLPNEEIGNNSLVSNEELNDLTDEILEILGVDPTSNNNLGKEIQKDLAARLEYLACNGLSKDLRKELRERYLIPSNCSLIDAPATNLEIKAAVSELLNKKLSSIEFKQKQTASVIACLGEAITHMLNQKDKDSTLLKMCMDATRMACDLQYNNSLTRRTLILASLKKEMKDQLSSTRIDKFLFGKDLADTIKSAKAINKQGAELKAATNTVSRPTNSKSQNLENQHLNWKRAPTTATRNTPKTSRARESSRQKSQRDTSSRRSRQNTTRSRL